MSRSKLPITLFSALMIASVGGCADNAEDNMQEAQEEMQEGDMDDAMEEMEEMQENLEEGDTTELLN